MSRYLPAWRYHLHPLRKSDVYDDRGSAHLTLCRDGRTQPSSPRSPIVGGLTSRPPAGTVWCLLNTRVPSAAQLLGRGDPSLAASRDTNANTRLGHSPRMSRRSSGPSPSLCGNHSQRAWCGHIPASRTRSMSPIPGPAPAAINLPPVVKSPGKPRESDCSHPTSPPSSEDAAAVPVAARDWADHHELASTP